MSVAVEELFDVIDERTRELLDFRARTGRQRRRGWLVRRALLVADLVGLTIAFAVAQQAYAIHVPERGALNGLAEFLAFVASLPFWVVAAKIYGLYDKDEERTDHSTTDDFAGVFHLVTVCTFFLFALSRETRWFSPEFGKLVLFWLLAIACVTVSRGAARTYCRRQINYLQNTIIVGAGEVGQSVARKVLLHQEYGLNLVGFVDDDPREPAPDLEHLVLLGGPSELPDLVELLDIERVIFAFSNESDARMLAVVRAAGELNAQIDIVPRLFETVGLKGRFHMIEGVPLVGLAPLRLSR
jgi:FlaA1/EpsC-like NDP-sugar epimerase